MSAFKFSRNYFSTYYSTKSLIYIYSIFICLNLLVTICSNQTSKYSLNKYWKPDELVKEFEGQRIIDTNNFLNKTEKDYKFIEEETDLLEQEYQIKTFIIFINQMDYSYSQYFKSGKDIERFTNEVAFHLTKGDLKTDENTLIILFSIKDRQNRIRTGKVTKTKLTDKYAAIYLKNIKSLLKEAEYTTALGDLVEYITNNISGNNKMERLWEFLKDVLPFAIIILIIVVAIYNCVSERPMKNRLEKIKEISKKNISRDCFIDANCSICLEEFSQTDLDKLKKDRSGTLGTNQSSNSKLENKSSDSNQDLLREQNENYSINKDAELNTNPRADTEKNHPDIINIDDIIMENNEKEGLRQRNSFKADNELMQSENPSNGNNTNELKDESAFIAKLNCGHIFHSECIANWMNKKNTCPLCKKDLDDTQPSSSNKPSSDSNTTTYSSTHTNMMLIEELVNIQTVFYPRITRNYRLDYSSNTFEYSSIDANSGGSSSGLSGFISSSSSGGASSSW